MKNRHLIYFVVIGLFLGCFSCAFINTVSATGILKEYYSTGADSFVCPYYINWYSQTFTVGTVGSNIPYSVSYVDLKLYKHGTPTTVNVTIRTVDGSYKPTTTILSWGTTDPTTLTTDGGGEWRNVSMSYYLLSASTQYAIVVHLASNDPNYIIWNVDSTSPTYAGGQIWYSANSGSTWSGYAYDGMFRLYGSSASTSTISCVRPVNNITGVCPCCIIFGSTIANSLGESMTLAFGNNATGTFKTISSVVNGTYYFMSCNYFDRFSVSYDWRVLLTSSTSSVYSSWQHFTTTSNLSCMNARNGTNGIDGIDGINGTNCNCSENRTNSYTKEESDNNFLSALLSIEPALLFLGILLSLWVYFVSKYFEYREFIFSEIQFGLSMPLTLCLAVFSFNYPLGFILVMLLPIFAIWILIDGILYRKKGKR
jgi:hypothetical protein